jgi:hypothetical protein
MITSYVTLRYTHTVETILFTAQSELVFQLRAEIKFNGGSRFVRNADDHPPAYTPNTTAEIVFIAMRTPISHYCHLSYSYLSPF